jgi:DNA-binding MarR family transcriptional regulator
MDFEPLPTDDPRLLTWRAFLQAHSALVSVLSTELAAKTELTLSEFDVLITLRLASERHLRMQDLAGSVLLSKSGITRLVDRLVSRGLVERIACESDRRVTYAGITEEGLRVLRESSPVHRRVVAEHFARFIPPEEVENLTALLLRVFRSASEASALPSNGLQAEEQSAVS